MYLQKKVSKKKYFIWKTKMDHTHSCNAYFIRAYDAWYAVNVLHRAMNRATKSPRYPSVSQHQAIISNKSPHSRATAMPPGYL